MNSIVFEAGLNKIRTSIYLKIYPMFALFHVKSLWINCFFYVKILLYLVALLGSFNFEFHHKEFLK